LKVTGSWTGRTRHLRPLGFAILAPLGLVFEALVGEKHLFAGGENKLLIAFRAFQDLIVIFHTLLRGSTLDGEAYVTSGKVRLCWDTPRKNVGPNSDWSEGALENPGSTAGLCGA
jgi:hypothetical protein